MPHLSDHQMNTLKQSLLTQKQEIEQRLAANEHLGMAESLRDETGDLSVNDNHPGDLASEMFEREKDIALLENTERLLSRIDHALEQMDRGNYGKCAECGRPIPYERLLAVPFALHCAEHAPEQSNSKRRPVEERFLQPPFGRTSLDENDEDSNRFDGEDAWQIVASWGTSNTPAMAEGNNISDYDEIEIEAADDLDGFVEPFESFVATDIFGENVTVVRNKLYHKYLADKEGDPLLEPDREIDD